ncbi:hypothetical protein FRB95_007766 [Tulasnella sp. JGI-2019a]|nr:hypothetical protein FRB95_007766 [Tulasnella sp. JGI-2019a]
MNAYKPQAPTGRAMTLEEQDQFDGMLQDYCVDARQGFFNALKTWPTVSSDEVAHFNNLVQSLGSSQPAQCPAPVGPVATTHIASALDPPSQITRQSVQEQASCEISGGGPGILTPAAMANLQASFAGTMSEFHQAVIRSQLCQLNGLSDDEAAEVTQMVDGIQTVSPASGALTPEETTTFLNQLQSWCLPARQTFVAQLMA